MSRILERRVSFNRGEISPLIDGRIDIEQYQNSCRRMHNAFPALYGGAFSRAGLMHVLAQPNGSNPARLQGFEFSADENLVMVFSVNADDEGEFTVITGGDSPAIPTITNDETDGNWTTSTAYTRGTWIRSLGAPVGIFYCLEDHTSGTMATDVAAGKWVASTSFRRATPYTADEIAELQFAQQNDLVFITHPNHPPHVLSRYANNHWTIAPLVQEWPALRADNITAHTLAASATSGTGITLTASSATFQAGHVGSRWVIRHRREDPYVTLLIKGASINDTSSALFVLGAWSLSVVTGNDVGKWEVIGVVERSSTGTGGWETIRSISASRADRSGIITGTEIDPCYLRVRLTTIDEDSGSIPPHGKFTLEAVDPDHYGIVEITGYTDSTHVTAAVVFPLANTNATRYWAEGAWSDYRGWPRTVCIHDTRLFFGGNEAQPQTIWASVIDDFYNFRLTSLDDAGIARTLAQKANAIQWMVSQDTLIVGTAGAEGPISGSERDTTLTPANFKAGRFTQNGSVFIQAAEVQDAVIFIRRGGRCALEFSFTFESDGYKANNLNLLAEHIAEAGITQIAVQKVPDAILWCVDAGGELLGVAYERSQRVAGWFRFATGGTYSDTGELLTRESFESVAVIPGDGDEDEVWVTVNRDGVRHIERFQPNHLQLLKDRDQARICCADSAVIHDGSAATVIGGLAHLEGREVCILADGIVVPSQTVTGGQITLETAAAVVIAGLPFHCYTQPSFLETNDPGSRSKGATKSPHRIALELWNSSGGSVSMSNGREWEKIKETNNLQQGEAMDSARPLRTGIYGVLVGSRSARQISPIIRQTLPLPLNLQSLHVWYELNAT